jgi:hypothetical protein
LSRTRTRSKGVPRCRVVLSTTVVPERKLSRRLIERAIDAGARPAWVVADAVYGADSKLRFFLEERQQPYVMAVTSAQSVWVDLSQQRVKTLAAHALLALTRARLFARPASPRLTMAT